MNLTAICNLYIVLNAPAYKCYVDIFYYIETDFDSVFLINGVFREKSGLLSYRSGSPLYITALPLSAVLLPYTVKVVDGYIIGNENLADSYTVTSGKYIVKLKQRHNYVYSPLSPVYNSPEKGCAFDLFRAVKKGNLGDARSYMTKSLSSSIDDDNLTAFFAPYIQMLPNRFSDIGANYLLARDDKKCEAYNFAFSGTLIDNIEQLENF